jgi:hypothetical protein
MKNIGLFSIYLLVELMPTGLRAQAPAQNIRGQVTDAASGRLIPGVTVVLVDVDPLTGTTTDSDGQFILRNVPVGRQTLRFSSIGFETRIIPETLVTSSRETVLNITLRESVFEMEEVEVRPEVQKDQPLNIMAISGARLLSMEEASRYAGGFDDPARLTSSFAGVSGSLSDNAIVVRGNAPKGLLWLMEGIEIPTPSHFANLLTFGGGGITALSSHMISDSDFHTGAFPAEFGNALSGVFDLNIRNGNNRNIQNIFKVGAIGIDASSEGPIPGIDNASYLFNYRYSTFSLITPLLPEDAGDIIYQNLSYKFNFPTSNAGTFSLWGIGATDRSGQSADQNPENWTYNQDREDANSPTRFGAIGLRHNLLVGTNTILTTTFAASGNELRFELDRYNDDATLLAPREYVNTSGGKLAIKTVLSNKFSSRHSNRTGATLNRLGYDQRIRFSNTPGQTLSDIVNTSGHTYLYQGYTQSRFDLGRFTLTAGVHLQHFTLTNNTSQEPRGAIRYAAGKNAFSLAYGRHSQTEPVSIYFANPANRDLELTKANHVVAGFSRMISSQLKLNIEGYYQYLTDVPVIDNSAFSLINLELDWFIDDALINRGAGRNYGIDLTLERYFSRSWYALLTGSLFDSQYRGGDNIWRDTRFNRRYTTSLLTGKEWEFRRNNKVRMLGVSGRINLQGGKRISPVDEMQSLDQGAIIYDLSQAFTRQEPYVLYADMTIEYRVIRSRATSVWSLQLMNLTGYKDFYGHRINLRQNTVEEEREMILIPNLSYKIEF